MRPARAAAARPRERLRAYKISKRYDDDISASAWRFAHRAGRRRAWRDARSARRRGRHAGARPRAEAAAARPALDAKPRVRDGDRRRCAPSSSRSPTCAPRAAYRRSAARQPAAALLAGKRPRGAAGRRAHAACGRRRPEGGAMNTPDRCTVRYAPPPLRPRASSPRTKARRAQVGGERDLHRRHPRGAGHAARGARPVARVAHGRCAASTLDALRALPGVRGVLPPPTFPATNDCGPFVHDEPIFADDKVEHVGQVIAGRGRHRDAGAPRGRAQGEARTSSRCRRARRRARRTRRSSYVLPPVHRAPRRARRARCAPPRRTDCAGTLESRRPGALLPGRPGRLRAAAGRGRHAGALLSTQHPGEVQHWVAHALGMSRTTRCGGVPAHGRRLRRQGNAGRPRAPCGPRWPRTSCKRPVKLRLDRDDDFMVTGKRHPLRLRLRRGLRRHGPHARRSS